MAMSRSKEAHILKAEQLLEQHGCLSSLLLRNYFKLTNNGGRLLLEEIFSKRADVKFVHSDKIILKNG
jgi:hypothetical protein